MDGRRPAELRCFSVLLASDPANARGGERRRVSFAAPARDMEPPRPGMVPTGAGGAGRLDAPRPRVLRQPMAEMASTNVADGRMTAAAFAGSGW